MLPQLRRILIFLFLISCIQNSLAVEPQTEQEFRSGEELLANEKFAEAVLVFEVRLKEFELQKNSKAVADTLYHLGICYNSLAQYRKALDALTRAERIHSELGNKEAAACDLTERANSELLLANADQSISLSESALRVHREMGNRKGEADTLRYIGLAYVNKGNFQKAMEYAQSSLAIAEEIQDQLGIASSLKDEGVMHYRLGELDKALVSFEKALKIAEEINSKKVQSRILSGIGMVVDDQGDRKGQIQYNQRAEKLAEEIGDRLQQCIVLLNSGAGYYDLNDFGKSYDCLYRGTKIAEEIGNKRLFAGGLIGLAMVNVEAGRSDSAMNDLQKAARILEEVGDKFTLTYALNELGSNAFESGNYAAALKYHQRGLKLREETNDKNGTAYSLNYVAEAYYRMGNFDKAVQILKDSLLISEPNNFKHPMSETYMILASIQHDKNEMNEALESAEKAIQIAGEIENRATLWHALNIEGMIYRDSSQTEKAIQAFQKTVNVIESIRSDFELPEEKAGYLETKLDAYENLITAILHDKNIAEAFEYTQRSKARAFLDTLAEMRVETESALESDLRTKKEHVINQLVEVQSEIREVSEKENPLKEQLQKLDKRRMDLEEQYSNIILEIRRSNPQIGEAQYPQPTSLEQAKKLLDERSILLEYFVGKSASYMFAVTHDQAQVYVLSNEKTLSSLITQIRDVLQKPDLAFQLSEKSHTKFVNLAFDLHQNLFKPIQSLAQGKSRIIISPDGPLHYLPFEVLLSDNVSARSPNFAHLPYLARDFEIRYVPSVSVFSLFAQRDLNGQKIQHKQLLAFADPAFGKGSQASSSIREWVGTLGALPYTRPEVQGIASLYPSDQTNVFIGSQATEKNLKSLDLQQYKYIHFASHGLIDEQKPQFSALILSPDAKNEEDGFLTAREVFDLKLNADLVVLSACKTGLGKRIRGEGVTGLSRAFLCAGAPSVLVSLWNVYDHSTAEFMKDFYQSLEEQKMNKTDALREARLKMMKTSKYSHPYYWAPFVLIGNN